MTEFDIDRVLRENDAAVGTSRRTPTLDDIFPFTRKKDYKAHDKAEKQAVSDWPDSATPKDVALQMHSDRREKDPAYREVTAYYDVIPTYFGASGPGRQRGVSHQSEHWPQVKQVGAQSMWTGYDAALLPEADQAASSEADPLTDNPFTSPYDGPDDYSDADQGALQYQESFLDDPNHNEDDWTSPGDGRPWSERRREVFPDED
jgi:hypothetical protein